MVVRDITVRFFFMMIAGAKCHLTIAFPIANAILTANIAAKICGFENDILFREVRSNHVVI